MILFCDTSALAKLYVAEAGSDWMQRMAQEAQALAVSRISWAEMHAAVARRAREVPDDAAAMEQVRQRLKSHWPSYIVLEITQTLVELAGDYTDTFALRGYDSVQLATAAHLQRSVGQQIQFACFDARLNKAAAVLGFNVIRP